MMPKWVYFLIGVIAFASAWKFANYLVTMALVDGKSVAMADGLVVLGFLILSSVGFVLSAKH